MRQVIPAMLILILASAALSVQPRASSQGLWCVAPERRGEQVDFERSLNAAVDPANLSRLHALLAARPHRAGSAGDLQVIEILRSELEGMGLEVEVQWLDLYLAEPVAAELELQVLEGADIRERIALEMMELPVESDPFSADEELDFGWNAYAASGEASGEVVYVNYGRKEDFRQLAERGIDLTGKIAIARYGGNFRGYKAKFAEEAGAAGLVIFTDPKDSGYVRGLMYPEGGYATPTQIQRGSIKTLPYPGDPLTPGWAAVPEADRIDPDALEGLPSIPVQPIGWGAAQKILSRMQGQPVPHAWQGGLPFNYRLTGGPDLHVRLAINQPRRLQRTANVVATLPGATHPDEEIVIGGHHDAWTHGAGDPLAGLIIVLETARVFAEQARAGRPPARTLRFAGWAAEEYGLIGSTEWVEAHRDRLRENCIAYFNLDMSAMGPRFWSSAAPVLKRVIVDAARDVPQAGAPEVSVFERWSGSNDGAWPSIGSLGGGSDHVGFYCHLGVPAASMGARGSRGVSYHSAYDTLAWYHQVVGDDYEPAAMIARVVNIAVARLANADVLPIDPARYEPDLRTEIDAIERRAASIDLDVDVAPLRVLVDAFAESASHLTTVLPRSAAGAATNPDAVERLNAELRSIERVWLDPDGLPERPWYQSLYVAPDQDSGYSAWMLPALRHAVERGDRDAFRERLSAYQRVLTELTVRAKRIETLAELLAGSVAHPIEGVRDDASPTRWGESGQPENGDGR
ncbi:MAG: M28 family peptidase [Planctomycetota bacterium]